MYLVSCRISIMEYFGHFKRSLFSILLNYEIFICSVHIFISTHKINVFLKLCLTFVSNLPNSAFQRENILLLLI